MDWLERMNKALDYIENHLDDELDYKEIAKAAYCSEFHFSRMFSSISGISLSEYIRRRRLTLAAFEIQKSDIRIIDVAINRTVIVRITIICNSFFLLIIFAPISYNVVVFLNPHRLKAVRPGAMRLVGAGLSA